MPPPAPFRFLPAEVQEMEARLQPLQNPSPNHVTMEELARKFSASAERIGKVVIHPKQVREVVQVMFEDWGRIPHLDFNQNLSRLILRCGYSRVQVRTWFCNRRYNSPEGKAARAAQTKEKSSARGAGASHHPAGGGSCQCQCLCIEGRQGL
jgi:hypothetical protein